MFQNLNFEFVIFLPHINATLEASSNCESKASEPPTTKIFFEITRVRTSFCDH